MFGSRERRVPEAFLRNPASERLNQPSDFKDIVIVRKSKVTA